MTPAKRGRGGLQGNWADLAAPPPADERAMVTVARRPIRVLGIVIDASAERLSYKALVLRREAVGYSDCAR